MHIRLNGGKSNQELASYEETLKIIQTYIPDVGIGKQGFAPI
jgi:hypothetical protein